MVDLQSENELKNLVVAFENGRLLQDQWHHSEHLAICYWYLCNKTFLETVFRMKLGILKYNEKYKVEQTRERGYHETITLFFIKLVQSYIYKAQPQEGRLVELLKPLLDSNKEFLPVLWRYYSRSLLNSERARVYWVEPDLQHFESANNEV